MIKPPLGIAPHWYVYRKRMEELNEAIKRQLEYLSETRRNPADHYKLIAKWSEETKMLALFEAEAALKGAEHERD